MSDPFTLRVFVPSGDPEGSRIVEKMNWTGRGYHVPRDDWPNVQAWHVTNKGDDSFWTKVGAAWPHRDGKGLSLILSIIPMNGQIVLREPLPKA
jgi:hypothetical protein